MAPQREWFEKDYYSVLGVAKDASEKDVTRAYRKLAKQYHPDANPGDAAAEERFKEVSSAYDVLGDAEKRKEYDQVRDMVASEGFRGAPGGFGGGGFGDAQGFSFEGGDFSDILSGLFGGGGGGGFGRQRGRARSAPQRGEDLETELHLEFLDAIHGVTTSVRFTADAACSVCHGTGAEPGTLPEPCATCGGRGQVAVDQGPFSFAQVCPTCGGRGQIIRTPCHQCHGRGVEVRPREVKVKVPAGVSDGQRIRVKGRGAAGVNGGPSGDLFVVVHVHPHELFGRQGRNLTVRVPVSFPEAALGAQVRVPTLGDPVTVKVPAGTQSGTTVKVRGRGVPAPNAKSEPGDLLVTFDVVVPSELDAQERKAVEALAETLQGNPRERLGV